MAIVLANAAPAVPKTGTYMQVQLLHFASEKVAAVSIKPIPICFKKLLYFLVCCYWLLANPKFVNVLINGSK
jgi:hypothetical protein